MAEVTNKVTGHIRRNCKLLYPADPCLSCLVHGTLLLQCDKLLVHDLRSTTSLNLLVVLRICLLDVFQAMDGSMNLEQALEERLRIINCKPADIKRFIKAHPPSSRLVPVSSNTQSDMLCEYISLSTARHV